MRKNEDEACRLVEENAIVAEIGRIISSSLNIEEVYERFAEEVRKVIPFDRIVIDLGDPEHRMITLAYVTGIDIPGSVQVTLFRLPARTLSMSSVENQVSSSRRRTKTKYQVAFRLS
ncbi:MAG TPA: hypothetical protein VLK23_03225 [Thermodesulfobacteriota bacterium]|nr:hypothetical protein [Thermodesulfobacteriota bacterium]